MSDAPHAPGPSSAALTAAARFAIDPTSLDVLGAFESEVLAGARADDPVVLKVMPTGHRTLEQARAEVEWLLALGEAGVPAAEPLLTADGDEVAWLEREQQIAVAYRRTPGRHLGADEWTPQLTRRHGRLAGLLQAHTRAWRSPAGLRRSDWLEQHSLTRAPEAIPGDTEFHVAVAEVAERVGSLVDTPDDHRGLIHTDLHPWNILVDDDGTLTAIDFDDAAEGPYLFDLVIPLYYAVTTRRDRDAGEVADAFLGPYLEGFDAVAPRPPGDAEAVAALLAQRQADLATYIRLHVPEEAWDDQLRAAAERLLERTKARHEVVPIEVLRAHFG